MFYVLWTKNLKPDVVSLKPGVFGGKTLDPTRLFLMGLGGGGVQKSSFGVGGGYRFWGFFFLLLSLCVTKIGFQKYP